ASVRGCFPSWLIALRQTQGSAPTIRYSLPFLPVANRQSPFAAVFPSWLIATPTLLPFDQSPVANRPSLPSSCLPQHFLGATRDAEDMGKDFGGGLIQFGRDEGADGHFHQRLR
ncbi:MAG: hypothetical protein OXFUSZZB_002217, partial [Candidatus Fervidibacter sp.]